jgi:uncharacterized repeat protein (TIGR03803 family)
VSGRHRRAAAAAILALAGAALFIGAARAGPPADGAWAERVLLHFPSGAGGANPAAGLTLGPSGALYGTVANGGAHGFGGVFEVDPAATGSGARLVWSFTGGTDGAYPMAGVILGAGGKLYGTTLSGGDKGHGTVFALTPPPAPTGDWTENVLFSFSGDLDGASPAAALAEDGAGALYGTTISGGSGGRGVVFRLTQAGAAKWRQTVLHSFAVSGDGELPFAGVAIAADGVLYGTATYGGNGGFGCVFALTPMPNSGWDERVLYGFSGKGDGGLPTAAVAIGARGALYGTTRWGGAHASGVAFELTPRAASGRGWTETVLHSFGDGFDSGDDGGAPMAGVAITGDGELYGTTDRGGKKGHGTVYALLPPTAAGGAWTARLLYSFGGGDGDGPAGGVVAVGSKLFGTTFRGGSHGAGTVFELAR